MGKMIAAFTIFSFLFFAVSTADIASDPVGLPGSDVVYKSSKESATDSDLVFPVLPTEKPTSELVATAANDPLPESETTQIFNVRPVKLPPSLIISRQIPIQRHAFDRSTQIPLRFVRRHPCRKFKKAFMIPTKRSYGNDMMISDKTTSVDLETLGDQIPTKWLEFKHKYGHRHHHHHHDRDEKFETKYEFNEEKLNSMSGRHKEKKREHKGGLMRRIRKFLKHTFD